MAEIDNLLSRPFEPDKANTFAGNFILKINMIILPLLSRSIICFQKTTIYQKFF